MSWLNRLRSSPLLKSSGTYIAFTALNVLISLVSMSALTRLLGPEQYGVIGALTALTVLASAVVGLNTNGLVSVQYFRADRDTFRASVGASLGIMAATAAATAIVFAVASDEITALSGVTPLWQWTIVVAAAGRFALTLAQTVWQVQGNAVRYGLWQLASSILFLAITIVLVTQANLGWEGYAVGQAVAPVLLGFSGLALIAGSGMITLRLKREHFVQALRFGLPLLPHTLAGVAIANMDRLILSGTVGPGETGIYFVAVQVSSILMLIGGAVNQAWVPWLFSRLSSSDASSRARVVRATYALFAAFAAVTVALVLSGPLLVRILATDHFSHAATLLPFLCPAAALSGMYYLVVNYIIYAKRTALLSGLTVAAAVVQAILTVSLAIRDGTIGVAIATLLSSAFYFGLTWYAASRLVPMPWLRRS